MELSEFTRRRIAANRRCWRSDFEGREINGEMSKFLSSDRRSLCLYLTPGGDVYPALVSRASGWPGASRPGKGQLSTRCHSPLQCVFHHLDPPVGIGAVSLDAGSRALRQYSRAPRQKTVSRLRALDGRRRRFAIHALTRRRDTRTFYAQLLLSLCSRI